MLATEPKTVTTKNNEKQQKRTKNTKNHQKPSKKSTKTQQKTHQKTQQKIQQKTQQKATKSNIKLQKNYRVVEAIEFIPRGNRQGLGATQEKPNDRKPRNLRMVVYLPALL